MNTYRPDSAQSLDTVRSNASIMTDISDSLSIKDQERQPIFKVEHNKNALQKATNHYQMMRRNKALFDAGMPLENGLNSDTFELEYEKAECNFYYQNRLDKQLPSRYEEPGITYARYNISQEVNVSREWSTTQGFWITKLN